MYKSSYPMNQNGLYFLDLACRIYVNRSSKWTMVRFFLGGIFLGVVNGYLVKNKNV